MNAEERRQRTALHYALLGGDVVKVLIQNGADVNAVEKQTDSTSLRS